MRIERLSAKSRAQRRLTSDRHYGHLARDGREHAIKLLDSYASADDAGVYAVDVTWTLPRPLVADSENGSHP